MLASATVCAERAVAAPAKAHAVAAAARALGQGAVGAAPSGVARACHVLTGAMTGADEADARRGGARRTLAPSADVARGTQARPVDAQTAAGAAVAARALRTVGARAAMEARAHRIGQAKPAPRAAFWADALGAVGAAEARLACARAIGEAPTALVAFARAERYVARLATPTIGTSTLAVVAVAMSPAVARARSPLAHWALRCAARARASALAATGRANGSQGAPLRAGAKASAKGYELRAPSSPRRTCT